MHHGKKEDDIDVGKLRERLCTRLNNQPSKIRRRFEICHISGQHIGWVTSYYIDKDKSKLAIVIDIPNQKYRGKKLGEAAFTLFASYLLRSEEVEDIYTETWSGNTQMIKLAEKCCFEEVGREILTRTVRDKLYDGLTFKLNKGLFWNKYNTLQYYRSIYCYV